MTAALPRSPLAPAAFPDLAPVAGVRSATGNSGTRYKNRDDLLLVEMPPGTASAGVFTRSATAAAPVHWCREVLAKQDGRALLVNAGNANAFTGAAGMVTVEQSATAVAQSADCSPRDVYIASTGVIGEVLDGSAIAAEVKALHDRLSPGGWQAAADAIRTTDTFAKGSGATIEIDGHRVTLAGIAKGSGMIAPDMATMLSFLFTDAAIAPPVLQKLLNAATRRSFNAITVDSDTSTSDTALLFATGEAGHAPITEASDRRLAPFRKALDRVCLDLAHQIVRDGEGAQKFIEIAVTGATSASAARKIAMAIANSPLVKTAIAGEDANWGRIVMAVGKSGARADRDRLRITIGGVTVTEKGAAVSGYDEAPVADHLRGREIAIGVDIGLGKGRATVWTCDLTHGYIDINADYRS